MSKLKIPKYNPPSFESLANKIPTMESYTSTAPTIESFMAQTQSMDSFGEQITSKLEFNVENVASLDSIINVPTVGDLIEKGGQKVGLKIDGGKIDEMQKEIDDFKSNLQSAAVDKITDFAEKKGINLPKIPDENELMDMINVDGLENLDQVNDIENAFNNISSLNFEDPNNIPKVDVPSIDSIIQMPNLSEKMAAIEQYIQSKLNS